MVIFAMEARNLRKLVEGQEKETSKDENKAVSVTIMIVKKYLQRGSTDKRL